jgi:hypothetical protein
VSARGIFRERRYNALVSIDRDRPQDDAEAAVKYRARLIAKGLSKAEANELTVAWILSRRVDVSDPDEDKPEWLRER